EGPEYYALRIKDYYHLSTPATRDELLDVCHDRGAAVVGVRLYGGGYYLRLPEPLIVIDPGAPAFVLAHELYHHIMADLAEWDECGRLALYVFSAQCRTQHEADANRFAALLCEPTR